MIRIVLTNQKGGVGKTTSSIEIANALTRKGRRVLLIDFDQQCNLSHYCDCDLDAPNIFDVLNAECPVENAIQHIDSNNFGYDKLDIIAGSEKLSLADKIFIAQSGDDKYLLDEVLNIINDNYDYAIIDSGPTRNISLTMCYAAADYLILPAECDEGSRLGIEAIEDDLLKLKNSRDKVSHADILGYIMVKYEKTLMHEIGMENLYKLTKNKTVEPFVMKVSKTINMSTIKTMKQAITKSKPGCTAARDYFNIVDEIIKRVE